MATETVNAAVASCHPALRVPLSPLPRLMLSMTAGMAGGLLAYIVIDLIEFLRIGSIPLEDVPSLDERNSMTAAEINAFSAKIRWHEYQKTAYAVAGFGAIVGGLLGFAAGLTRKSPMASTAGMLGGLVVGAGAGALGGVVDLYTLERLWPMDFDHTYKAMLGHSAAFMIAGVGIGSVAGLAGRQLLQTVGVVLAAALIAGLVYPGVAAYLFPVLNTDAAVPDGSWSLLLWTILPAALMGLGIGRIHSPLPR